MQKEDRPTISNKVKLTIILTTNIQVFETSAPTCDIEAQRSTYHIAHTIYRHTYGRTGIKICRGSFAKNEQENNQVKC